MFSTTDLGVLTDAFAFHALIAPRTYGGNRRDSDDAIAYATNLSRTLFGDKHSSASAHALVPLIESATPGHDAVLSRRQMHVLLTVAAAELLERDQVARVLAAYREPGLDLWYRPVSLTALRHAIHRVLAPYPPAKRTHLLISLAERTDAFLLLRAPLDAKFAPEFIAAYRSSKDEATRLGLVQRMAMSPEEQCAFARSDEWRIRRALTRNPHLAAAAVAIFLEFERDERVLVELAAHSGLSVTAQVALARQGFVRVKRALTENENLQPAAQRVLVRDRDLGVREGLARARASLSEDVQFSLALMRDGAVASILARRSGLAESVQLQLSRSVDGAVLLALADQRALNPKVCQRMARSLSLRVRAAVARARGLAPDLQQRLSRDPSLIVRGALAENPTLMPQLMERLVHDRKMPVRRLMALNPRCPADLQAMLARDAEVEVRSALARTRELDPTAERLLATDPSNLVRTYLAQRAHLLASTQAILACDESAIVRSWVTRQASISEAVRTQLLHDPDPQIRQLMMNVTHEQPATLRQQFRICDINDPVDRLDAALNRWCDPSERALNHEGVERALEAAVVLDLGYLPRSNQVKDAISLPGLDDLVFPTAPIAQQHFDALGVRIRFLQTGREQKLLGRLMANCLIGDSYADDARSGRVLVGEFSLDGRRYAASWRATSRAWRQIEIESAEHPRRVSREARKFARKIADHLNSIQPAEPLSVPARRQVMDRVSIDSLAR